ncbi:hypothetical protein M1L60_10095 [Actinoplanes sp. TRM 88003]|uniref:Uncharacterized protein n=1 Tax=Paractinoplanes aksuensis TaxID=2939490 RepID=A0ABT1DKC8_9ACTN|nr:hypothetical protein [Actinoplanes aksuensis]MCO8270943.1 hypothetical protein [Actinoplanes aksuensis]
MRRLVFPVIVASGLVMIGSSAAFAEDPAPTVSVPAVAGKKMCKISSKKIDEASGLVATKSGYVVVNDSTDEPTHKRIFFLDTKCEITKEVEYSGKGPLDPEDLILSPDGTKLWIADIGDNRFDTDDRRPTVSLWSMPSNGSAEPTIHRLTYPQGDAHDAEALLLNGDGSPLIVTREIGKPAYVYQPTAPLKPKTEEGVPMKRVAELPIGATQTDGNPLARIGNQTISGGAVAPGGKKVALRTYTDALEWDVPNGDVLAALKGKPRTTGLPNEITGEAISYSPDGKFFYTVSDMNGETETANYILRYTPATTVATAAKNGGEESGDKWYANLELSDITYAVGGVGLVGLILVGAGVFGITRHRKRLAAAPAVADDDDFKNPLEGDPETELIGVGGAAQRAGVYGGARSGPAANGSPKPANGVYGGKPKGNGVYGGAPAKANGQQPAPARAGVYGGGPGQPPRGPQGQPPRGPQGQPPRGPQGQPARGPQGQPARGPQGQPPRGPQGQPVRGPQGQPARGPQGQPARGPQGQPARGPQGQPPRGPQGQPPRGPQGQPPRGPQGQPARGPQGQPPRGPQGQPPRGPQGQPARGPQGQPPRGGGGGVYGGNSGGQPPVASNGNDFRRSPESRFDGYGPR